MHFYKDDRSVNEVKAEIVQREKEFTTVSVDYMNMKPSYFNTGCCCFSDGDITGIEIANGYIKLIKWSVVGGKSEKIELEKISLRSLTWQLSRPQQ